MHSFQTERLGHIDFNDDFLTHVNHSRCRPYGRSRDEIPFFCNSCRFHHNDIGTLHEPFLEQLSEYTDVVIGISHTAIIDSAAQIFIRMIGKPAGNAMYPCQSSINFITDGCPGIERNLKMLPSYPLCQRQRYGFGIPGRCKPRHGHNIIRMNQLRRFFGRCNSRDVCFISYTI